jgi:hypothetical protein
MPGAKKCKHCGELLDPTLRAADEARRAAAQPRVVRKEYVQAREPSVVVVKSGSGILACGCWVIVLIVGGLVAIAVMGVVTDSVPGDAGRAAPPRGAAQNPHMPRQEQPAGPRQGVSRANYDRIADGMSVGQVEAILGPGREDMRAGNLRVLHWQSGVIGLRIISITFEDDRVAAKAILD